MCAKGYDGQVNYMLWEHNRGRWNPTKKVASWERRAKGGWSFIEDLQLEEEYLVGVLKDD